MIMRDCCKYLDHNESRLLSRDISIPTFRLKIRDLQMRFPRIDFSVGCDKRKSEQDFARKELMRIINNKIKGT